MEIRPDDGSQVEVTLDVNCKVIDQEADDDIPATKTGLATTSSG